MEQVEAEEVEEEEVVEEEQAQVVVEEEQVEEAEAEESEDEVYEVTIKGKVYYVTNEIDSIIYALDENCDISLEVGNYVKGKAVFVK